jgi:hypothetical protein
VFVELMSRGRTLEGRPYQKSAFNGWRKVDQGKTETGDGRRETGDGE